MDEARNDSEPTGKARGGKARAEKLSADERKEIAVKAAHARWNRAESGTDLPRETHIGVLTIGDKQLACSVLENGMRVFSGRALYTVMGASRRGDKRDPSPGGARLPSFLDAKSVKEFISNDLMAALSQPIQYRLKAGGGVAAFGYEATLLPKICDVILAARAAGRLGKRQQPLATSAEILVRGFAHVGIIALIDEATGYQSERAKDALAQILEAFIAKELQPWVRTFPAEYYQELFRLRGLEYPKDTVQRPQYFGVLTNDVVYKRLAPGVLSELKKVIPRNDAGRPTAKYFQKLTTNIGYPKLREHLGAVVAIMQLSTNYHDFIDKLNRLRPRFGQQYLLPLEYEPEADN